MQSVYAGCAATLSSRMTSLTAGPLRSPRQRYSPDKMARARARSTPSPPSHRPSAQTPLAYATSARLRRARTATAVRPERKRPHVGVDARVSRKAEPSRPAPPSAQCSRVYVLRSLGVRQVVGSATPAAPRLRGPSPCSRRAATGSLYPLVCSKRGSRGTRTGGPSFSPSRSGTSERRSGHQRR